MEEDASGGPFSRTLSADPDATGQPIVEIRVGALTRGEMAGRYIALDVLGAGGMGVVYRAYDPELDRRVALKLVLARGNADARARLQREAKALARLSHPNVVAVYDVLPLGDDVCVAMELVDGEPLGAWLRQPGRGRAAILEAFIAAGRGLAAAHAAGLVHRDFKPSNVLVGRDGRVRVADFGLARPLGDAIVGAEPMSGIAGTPAYMAPEQARGVADARSDQYSFTIALEEALCGAVPRLADREALQRRARLPKWLRGVLDRGSQERPELRFPSMDALLDALGRGQRRRRRWIVGAAIAALAVVAVVDVSVRGTKVRVPCQGLDQHLAGVWDAPRRAELTRVFGASGRFFAADAAQRTAAALDGYGSRWLAARTQICRAAKVLGDEPEPRYLARVRCLDRRLLELGQLTELFLHADPVVMGQALPSLDKLVDPARCVRDDLALDTSGQSLAPVALAAASVAEVELARVGAFWRADQYATGLPMARALTDRARAIGAPRTLARALLLTGRLQDLAGENRAARRSYEEASLAAEEGHDDALRFEIKLALMAVLGRDLNELALLDAVAAEARALLRRLGDDEGREAEWLEELTIAETGLQSLASAQAHAERLLELRRNSTGLLRARTLLVAGAVRMRSHELPAARALLTEALAIATATLGPLHPQLVPYQLNLATLSTLEGDYPAGERQLRAALALADAGYGPESDLALTIYRDLGNNLRQQRRFDEAIALFQRIIDAHTRAGAADTLSMLGATTNIGMTLVEQSRYREAIPYLERAVKGYRARPGPLAPAIVWPLSTLGIVAFNLGQLDVAFARFAEAVHAVEQTLGVDSPQLIWPLSRWGLVLLEYERFAESQPLLERALKLAERAPPNFRYHAQIESALAELLWKRRGDLERARALMQSARARLEAAGATAAEVEKYVVPLPGLEKAEPAR